MRFAQLVHHSIEFGHSDLAHLLDEELVVLGVAEVLGVEIVVFGRDVADQA